MRLNVTQEVTFLSTALWMTSNGLEPTLMPAAYLMYSRDIHLVLKQGRSLPAAARQFIKVLRKTLAVG